jgi:hypothetical protein
VRRFLGATAENRPPHRLLGAGEGLFQNEATGIVPVGHLLFLLLLLLLLSSLFLFLLLLLLLLLLLRLLGYFVENRGDRKKEAMLSIRFLY